MSETTADETFPKSMSYYYYFPIDDVIIDNLVGLISISFLRGKEPPAVQI